MTRSWPHRLRVFWFTITAVLVITLMSVRASFNPQSSPDHDAWREFVPWCGSNRNPLLVEGKLRERFLWLMSNAFSRWDVEHVIRDGRLFTKGEGSSDGKPTSLLDIEYNVQWKVVSDIAGGITIDDVYFPPPPALIEAIHATESRFGPFPRRGVRGEVIGGPDERFEDCDLMRAAILKQQ